MLVPSIFGESLLDEFFDHPHQRTHFQSHGYEMMRTDVRDLGDVYEMTMNQFFAIFEKMAGRRKIKNFVINARNKKKTVSIGMKAGSILLFHRFKEK